MKNSKRGFIVPLLIIILAVFVIVGAVYFYSRVRSQQQLAAVASATTQPACTSRAGRRDPKFLVILTKFLGTNPDENSDTEATIDAKLNDSGRFYNENTYGTFTFNCGDVTVTPWIQVGDRFGGNTVRDDNVNLWMTDAIAAAAKTNETYNSKNYDYVYIVSPITDYGYDYGAFKSDFDGADKSNTAIFVNGPEKGRVWAHELGHALGLKHYGILDCSGTGSDIEKDLSKCKDGKDYNPETTMGMGSTDLAATQRLLLSVHLDIDKGYNEFFDKAVEDVSKSGLYTISAIENKTSSDRDYKTLVFSKSAVQETKYNYYIEYRELVGFDTNGGRDKNKYNNAVWTSMEYSGPGFNDNGLQRGIGFDDYDAQVPDSINLKVASGVKKGDIVFNDVPDGIKVTVASMQNDSITLCISFNNESCTPSVSASVSPTSVVLNSQATFSWTSSQMKSCAPEGYVMPNVVTKGSDPTHQNSSISVKGTPVGVKTLTVNCTGTDNKKYSASTKLTVTAPPPPPTGGYPVGGGGGTPPPPPPEYPD